MNRQISGRLAFFIILAILVIIGIVYYQKDKIGGKRTEEIEKLIRATAGGINTDKVPQQKSQGK